MNIRMPDDLTKQLEIRGDTLSDGVREVAGRYLSILDVARRELRDILTGPELSLLTDIHNGTIWEPHTIDVIRWSAGDAEPSYFDRWEVDRAALLAKLGNLDIAQCAALVDAIERFWRAVSLDMRVDPASILAESATP